MFTGIIQKTAVIVSAEKKGGSRIVRISKPKGWRLTQGQSIAVQGICSTIYRIHRSCFEVEYMPETLMKTTVPYWRKGDAVNLERSLRYGQYIDGHFTQGHIDARGTVVGVTRQARTREITIRTPVRCARYIANKGAIAIDGVSLTVVHVHGNTFSVALVPYTLAHTTLDTLRVNDTVNIETDLIARYLARHAKK